MTATGAASAGDGTWGGVRGKQVVLTGATHGIGLAAARELARRGARCALVGRDPGRLAAARDLVTAAGGGATVDTFQANLELQRDVRRLADELCDRLPRIQVLINNAGAMFATRQLTVEGFERTWALNHLAPFLLTTLLLERITASAPARIITTTSDAHKGKLIPFDDLAAERSYRGRGFSRYGETKLANILFTAELARRLTGTGVTANCVHPGLVASGFNRNNGRLMSLAMTLVRPFSRSPAKGADSIVWLADAEAASGITGAYVVDRRWAMPSRPAQDPAAARRLWEISEEQTRAAAPA